MSPCCKWFFESIMARDNRIDSIKGLLIILVIMGHVITSFNNTNLINHGVMGLIYIFHMPLFILISGYLTKNPEQQSQQNMWRGVWRIFVPMVIFHVISTTRVWYFEGNFLETLTLKFPYGILWYLISLIWWRIMLYYTPKAMLHRPALYLGIALAVSLFSGVIHLPPYLSLQRTLNFYIFFLMGYYYRQGHISNRLWKNNILHIAVVVVLLPLIFWLFPRCGNIMNGADYYGIQGLPQKAMIIACSIAMSLLVFNLTRYNKLLSFIGMDSLFYYLYHQHIINYIYYSHVHYFSLPTTFPFVVLYTALILGLLLLLHKVKFFRWLVHPTLKRKEQASN